MGTTPLGRLRTSAGRLVQNVRVVSEAARLITEDDPRYYSADYGLEIWLQADMGLQYGSTLRASGTTPPAWTITGTAERQVGLHLEIDSVAGGTALGQATYKWSENNGSTYQATGVVTAAGPTVLGTTGLSVSMAAGPYNIDNKWDITVAQWDDQSGLGNHAAQVTAASQPQFSLTGFGGYSAINTAPSISMGLVTPSIALGVHTILFAIAGTNGAAGGFAFGSITPDNYLWSAITPSSHVQRTGGQSRREMTVSWLRDGVRKSAGRTFDGTHASHLIYINGRDAGATNGSLTADPGLQVVSAPIYIGTRQGATGLSALYREFMAFSSAVPPWVMLALHRGMQSRCVGAIA